MNGEKKQLTKSKIIFNRKGDLVFGAIFLFFLINDILRYDSASGRDMGMIIFFAIASLVMLYKPLLSVLGLYTISNMRVMDKRRHRHIDRSTGNDSRTYYLLLSDGNNETVVTVSQKDYYMANPGDIKYVVISKLNTVIALFSYYEYEIASELQNKYNNNEGIYNDESPEEVAARIAKHKAAEGTNSLTAMMLGFLAITIIVVIFIVLG